MSYVGRVCRFSTLLQEAFTWVLKFSPLSKNQHLISLTLIWLEVSSVSIVLVVGCISLRLEYYHNCYYYNYYNYFSLICRHWLTRARTKQLLYGTRGVFVQFTWLRGPFSEWVLFPKVLFSGFHAGYYSLGFREAVFLVPESIHYYYYHHYHYHYYYYYYYYFAFHGLVVGIPGLIFPFKSKSLTISRGHRCNQQTSFLSMVKSSLIPIFSGHSSILLYYYYYYYYYY